MRKVNKPIAIIGAGLAGLTSGDLLRRNDVPFVLFEAGSEIAGLAASFQDDEGFSHDFGAHFITNRLADAIDVRDECYTVKHYGEAVYLGGKVHSYPFGLIAIPRMTISALKSRFGKNGHEPLSATEWFRAKFGCVLADEIALPIIEAWSGAQSDKLAASVGKSLPKSVAKTLYLKAAGKIMGRAVACGYNREMPETPSVYHVYPKKGVSTICEKLASGIEPSIRLNTPVDEILVEDEKVVAVKVKGEIIDVAAVISTAPANILAKLISGTDALNELKQFRFRPMIFVNIKFDGRGLLPDTVLWFPEKDFPFFRLTEAPISMPWLAPPGKTTITVDIGCEMGDEYWQMSDAALTELSLSHLSRVIPGIKSSFLGANVLRTPIAYPVHLREYETARISFEESSKVDKLLSIGRNGEFSHIFMEDVYWRTRKKVAALIGSL